MGLNDAPSGGIPYRIFGRRNAGKSSVVNAVTNQDLAVVSCEAFFAACYKGNGAFACQLL